MMPAALLILRQDILIDIGHHLMPRLLLPLQREYIAAASRKQFI